MGILQVQNINLSFGDRILLSNVSLTLGEHARTALAGGNGEGKSTLMKIIAGLIPCDGGNITKTKGMRVSYLPQSDIVFRENTLFQEVEKGFERFSENLRRQEEIENLLSNIPHTENANVANHNGANPATESNIDSLLFELNSLQEDLLNSDYYDREQRIYFICKGLGFTEKDMNRPCSQFSGGYQMRIALAKILCENPDLMMLDEPTNYLDIEAREWLLGFLKTYTGSVFLVCHDKGFLDSTVNEVYELFNSKLTRYSGNYTFYENQRRLEIQQLEAAYKKQQAEIEQTEKFIERFRYKATKSKQVQSRIKMLDKLEPIAVPSHLKTLRFSFPEPPHSPNDVVIIEHLTKKYGTQVVLNDLNLVVNKGQRLAVTGHNGIGKSTLLRIIAQQDSAIEGIVKLGPGIKIGYYAQDTADMLDLNGTVFSQVSSFGTEAAIRNALGAFLFSGDDIYKKVSVLSGGERSRLSLLKILLQPASLLILDEPTNHLDINSKDMLLNALRECKSTIIFVSHDAYFIRALADRILYLSDGTHQIFNGDYDYFQWKLDQHIGLSNDAPKPLSTPQKSQNLANQAFKDSFHFEPKPLDRTEANRLRNRKNKLKSELQSLMTSVEALEVQISEVNTLMNLAENYSNAQKITALSQKRQSLETQKNELELQWIEKTDQFEQEFGQS